jgi:hypothetical protein
VPVSDAIFDLWVEGQLDDTTVDTERLGWDASKLGSAGNSRWAIGIGISDLDLRPTRHLNVSLMWHVQPLRPRAEIVSARRVLRRVRRQLAARVRRPRLRSQSGRPHPGHPTV